MKTRRRSWLWLLALTLGWLLSRPHLAHALVVDFNKDAVQPSHYQSPEDLIDLIPLINELPRSFIWGRGYSMKIAGQSLQINHLNAPAKAVAHYRTCSIGFSYVTPVAGFMTSHIEVPLIYSPTPDFSSWSMNNVGDYIASFSRGHESPSLRLALSAKF